MVENTVEYKKVKDSQEYCQIYSQRSCRKYCNVVIPCQCFVENTVKNTVENAVKMCHLFFMVFLENP